MRAEISALALCFARESTLSTKHGMKNVTITEMHLVLVCFTYSFAQHLLSVTKGQLIFQALVLIKVTS